MSFHYFIPTRILFGAGQLKKLHEQELPGKKALIVISSGKSVRENGYLATLEDQLRHRAGPELEIEAVFFSNQYGILGKTSGADRLLALHRAAPDGETAGG